MKTVFVVVLACAALAGCNVQPSRSVYFASEKDGPLSVGSEVVRPLLGPASADVFITDADQIQNYVPSRRAGATGRVILTAKTAEEMMVGWIDRSTVWVCPTGRITSRKDQVTFGGAVIRVRYDCAFRSSAQPATRKIVASFQR